MKQLLFLLLLFPFTVFSQTYPAKGDLHQMHTSVPDTLGATDTLIYQFEHNDVPLDFTYLYEYSITVTSDSISGANDGTVLLQVSNSSNTDLTPAWSTIDTDTFDGTANQVFLYEGMLRARRLRVFITTPSGAKVITVDAEGTAKRVKW